MEPSASLADAIGQNPKTREAVVRKLECHAPQIEPPDAKILKPDNLRFFRRQALVSALWQELLRPEEEAWQQVAQNLEAWRDFLGPASEPVEEKPAPRPAPPPPSKKPRHGPRSENQALQQRLRQCQEERNRLQDELGAERQRRQGLREELAETGAERRAERLRATELKRRLESIAAASEREQLLQTEVAETQRQLHVLTQKFQILEEEREDLHGVLEDHDRFQQIPDEEIPSFRDRPLQPEEHALSDRLGALADEGRTPFRVLVVGGGEPQYRHREKLEEYAEVVGFRAHWRMAEYTSWHKEMDRLAADMEQHFDALVILHWNRTTFTRKARAICNKKGQKPCLTCHYEGFVSLRQTLQECLRQLLTLHSQV